MPIRIGDIDNDGFPDLLIVAKSKSTRHQSAFVLESLTSEHGRTFRLKDSALLKDATDVRGASFLDIGENVCLF